MSYIGKEPADSFISFAKQDFTTSATTSYTLDNAVTNENELALFINFVRQEPTTAYTASGTTLTLTSATSSSDDMYCVYLGQAKQTVNAPDGSVGSSQVAASIITGQTAETSIATDDTVLIHDTSAGALRKMTRANFVSGVGGDNTPAFEVYLSSNQAISSSSATKVQFNTEVLDTDGCYDNSTNYRFTPTTAGNYLINLMLGCNGGGAGTLTSSYAHIYKNGSLYIENHLNSQNTSIYYHTPVASAIINFNGSTDYVEAYGTITSSSSPNFQSGTYSRFWGFKLIT